MERLEPQTATTSQVGLVTVPRSASSRGDSGEVDSKPLTQWRSESAYVLLGDPGAGKSESFNSEAAECGGLYLSARDFISGIWSAEPVGRTLFIDGLDEVRAGHTDGRIPFDEIRKSLVRLGKPRFRLSCREADWLGRSDRDSLASVAPGGAVQVLHLDALTKGDVISLLNGRKEDIPDAEAFWAKAESFGLTGMFGNPLLLDLTIHAVADGGWPRSRTEIYERACNQLASERSPEHLAMAKPEPGGIDRLLRDAGLLCAVLLLSNKASWSLAGARNHAISLEELPSELMLHSARKALASKVFSTVAGESTPRHRTIAEFLAARALARSTSEGVPLGRVLAMIRGADGRPIESLRGLLGWLAACAVNDRGRILTIDPIGVVLYGDVSALSVPDRRLLLDALREAARRDRWFRESNWIEHPFGALACEEMTPDLVSALSASDRGEAHQAFIDCVLDALKHGQVLPQLAGVLAAWVMDAAASGGNRLAAYDAWKRNAGFQPDQALQWLETLYQGSLTAVEGRLAGSLLRDLYPAHLGPRAVLEYLQSTRERAVDEYSMFWGHALLNQSGDDEVRALADSWTKKLSAPNVEGEEYVVNRLGGELLAQALLSGGPTVSVHRLCTWLDIGLDKHGFARIEADARKPIAEWFEAHPETLKEVIAFGYRSPKLDKDGQGVYWQAEERTYGAKRPKDWFSWLLNFASEVTDADLARYCFHRVAAALLDPPHSLEIPSLRDVEDWVSAHLDKWPMAEKWLENAVSSPLDDWRRDVYLRAKQGEMTAAAEIVARKANLEAQLVALTDGTASFHLLHQVALAYNGRFSDIRGETGLDRVQAFLVSDEAIARAALNGLDLVLERHDLPSVDDVFNLEADGKFHYARPAALLAASRRCERDPQLISLLRDDQVALLAAFYLTDGIGNFPDWYKLCAVDRPSVLAPVLVRFATAKIRQGASSIAGLWGLANDVGQRGLAIASLPQILAAVPLRSPDSIRRQLNTCLLAAIHVLGDAQAEALIRRRLDDPALDRMQRGSWLVALLPYGVDAAGLLATWTGTRGRLVASLGTSLYEQGVLARSVMRLDVDAIERLVRILMTRTSAQSSGSGWVTPEDERERLVDCLLNALAANPSSRAQLSLSRISDASELVHWRERVLYAARSQRAAARESSFVAPSPAAVALAIANGPPASAADLQELMVEHLGCLEQRLRGSDTYLLRLFWNWDIQSGSPLDENSCRDLLLDRLRPELERVGVSIDREASSAGDTRVDMRAERNTGRSTIAIPIEVKKEGHAQVWTAWGDQLQRLYSIDPRSSGLGIYLVLWFGIAPRMSPEGIEPRDAAHFAEMLRSEIPYPERSRLRVFVMDLSATRRPKAKAAKQAKRIKRVPKSPSDAS